MTLNFKQQTIMSSLCDYQKEEPTNGIAPTSCEDAKALYQLVKLGLMKVGVDFDMSGQPTYEFINLGRNWCITRGLLGPQLLSSWDNGYDSDDDDTGTSAPSSDSTCYNSYSTAAYELEYGTPWTEQ